MHEESEINNLSISIFWGLEQGIPRVTVTVVIRNAQTTLVKGLWFLEKCRQI